jgi:hypothetical protein
MLTVCPILTKYAVPALFGAATKTFLDYKIKKVSISNLLVNLAMNSIIAVGFGSFSAHAFVGEFPSKDHFGFAIAFLGGAIGVNIILGLVSVDWREAIQSRINK